MAFARSHRFDDKHTAGQAAERDRCDHEASWAVDVATGRVVRQPCRECEAEALAIRLSRRAS